jgi:hypothetical protein
VIDKGTVDIIISREKEPKSDLKNMFDSIREVLKKEGYICNSFINKLFLASS